VADETRHSKAFDVELITDPDELAKQEGRNGLLQFDAVAEMVDYYLHPERPFSFRPSHLLRLHRVALNGISSYAGLWRPAGIAIKGSKHEPVGAHLIPEYIEEICDYVNSHLKTSSALHLSAYVMWRLNWIHPFTDGNGRTSRAASYMVLAIRTGYMLPGEETIPDQISENKKPYYEALEAADNAWEKGVVDVSTMEALLDSLLAKQLYAAYKKATNR
jgi:Fic family protein